LCFGIAIVFYGRKILAKIIEDQEESIPVNDNTIRKIKIVTYVPGILFIIKSIFNIYSVLFVEVNRRYLVEELYLWHALSFIITEMIPAFCAVYLTSASP